MFKRMLAVALTLGATVGALTSCGSDTSTNPKPQPGKGTVFTFVGDAPVCDILSFRVPITGMTLTPMGGGSAVSVFPPPPAPPPSIKVNFAELRDFSTVLSFNNVPEGTYDQATLMLSLPQIVVFDPTKNPPTTTITPKLSTMAPKVSIQPSLTVIKDQVSALRVDFDLLHSVQLDAQGQVTNNVTPVFNLSSVDGSGSEGFGEMDDLLGFVRSVSTFSNVQNFVGGFLLQLLAGTGSPAINVNLTSTTQVFGVSALNQLPTGSFVEVDGFVDAKGNLVANSVEVEDREMVEQNIVAFLGLVTALAKDSNGNLTQFNLYVRQEQPDTGFSVPLDATVVVNVSSSTTYQFSSRSTNFANLTFDATALAVGQEVVVHGKFTVPPAPKPPAPPQPTTVAADKVYLKLQTHEGNFSSLVQAGSDNKTGAFWLVPCASLFHGAPFLVFTNGQTAFVNGSGLSALRPQPALLVKGLLFFELQGGTVNGIMVPPGTWVLLAKQVHQLM